MLGLVLFGARNSDAIFIQEAQIDVLLAPRWRSLVLEIVIPIQVFIDTFQSAPLQHSRYIF